MKIKAQHDHELALEQQTAAIAKAQREYDAAAEEKKQAHELRVLKEKQDYERMQIEQKKLVQEMADTLKQRSRHTSKKGSKGWMEFGGQCNLSALLKGKALEVYSRLPVKDAQDYEVLKDALLKRFNLTEGFKQKFKTAKPEVNEAPGQFLARLESYLMRWIELAEVVQDFDGLKTVPSPSNSSYLESCSVPLAVFLRERKPEGLARLAEQYLEAHANSKTAVKKPVKEGFSSSSAFPHKKPETQSFCRTSQCKKTCFTCGKLGHNKKKLAEMEQRYSSRGGMPMNTHEC